MRKSGTVKWFNDSKGYGFLQLSDDALNRDIFVHYTEISGEGFKTLAEGQAVTFVLLDSPKGPIATEIEKVGQHV